MKISRSYKRIFNYVFTQRHNFFSTHFLRTVKRVVYRHFNIWDNLPERDFEENLKIIKIRPWNLHFELTNLCNANCIFCAYQHQQRPHSVMTDQIFHKALDDYCKAGGGNVVICGVVGDALVDKNAIARIRKLRGKKEVAHISITTNCIGLNETDVKEFLLSGVNLITVSTGPWEEKLYRKIFRTGSYKKMRNNVVSLLKENFSLGNPVAIKLSFRSNLSMKKTLELEDYQQIKHLPHAVEFNTDYDTWGNSIQSEDLLDGMTIRPEIALDSEPCQWFYQGPVIFPNGDVGICGCRDYNADGELILGNILDCDLIDLWQSEKMNKLRSNFYSRNFPSICKTCTNYVNLDLYRRTEGKQRAMIVSQRFWRN